MALQKQMQALAAGILINTLVGSKFYGELTFKFEEGNIVHLKLMRNNKIENLIEDFRIVLKEKGELS